MKLNDGGYDVDSVLGYVVYPYKYNYSAACKAAAGLICNLSLASFNN